MLVPAGAWLLFNPMFNYHGVAFLVLAGLLAVSTLVVQRLAGRAFSTLTLGLAGAGACIATGFVLIALDGLQGGRIPLYKFASAGLGKASVAAGIGVVIAVIAERTRKPRAQ
jgi:hypothetical protein